ncbi:MAG: MFS transporter [Chloroflexi bacterium]|nr:MFS transporter [Chloroflexota bacterium]
MKSFLSRFVYIYQRIKQSADYPRQFWFLFWGMLISSAGVSMIWPFMTIYIRQKLGVPITAIGLMLSLNFIGGLVTGAIAGPAVDRFGRKGAMVLGLAIGSVVLMAMSMAGTLWLWVIVMLVNGAFAPLYRIGSDAMIADLVEPDRRAGAYALLRLSANAGIALGPSVGGFVATASYALAFYIAATAYFIFMLAILFFVVETAPQRQALDQLQVDTSYGPILRDRSFLTFCAMYTLAVMAYSLIMVLLPVYSKENFGVPENQYGFIMATNAAMVVLFQYSITRVTKRYYHLSVLAIGSLFYALGVGSVAWDWSFATFLLSMVILTIGEMILVPTAITLTANLAPADKRGRYMSIYHLAWGIAYGIGPVVGGILNDKVAPVAIWYGGMVMGLVAALGFTLLARKVQVTLAPQQAYSEETKQFPGPISRTGGF